jgi:TolB-like protein
MQRLGRYDILERLGVGGMGEVYRARDTKLGRTVAIKVLPDAVVDDPERRERLLREARASAALSHPNICALFEVGGEDATRQYLVFEYVAGDTLRQRIAGRPLNVRTAIEIGVQLADALADAHAAGIVHRDIKPENIIITPRGHPKILDFGLASFTASGMSCENAATEMKTADGVTLGTAAYMSPEQALGAGYDHRTDIFSLGIVLYEMLTGVSPFKGLTPAATSIQIAQATPALPSTVNGNVPKTLDAIVMRALAKDPNHRYQSAATLAAELRSVAPILDEGEPAKIAPPVHARRARWRSAAVVIGAAVAIAAIVWLARATIARWFGPAPPPLVAVLPFDLIGAESQTYFADGLTEDVITRLGQLPGVRVLGRSTTREYRGQAPAAVARELSAGVVLTGAVQSDGHLVKVTVSLIDPKDGSQIWSDSYQKPLIDIFAVQNEIAEDVARNLRVTLTPSAVRARRAARQVNVQAYDLYLRARDAAARRDVNRAADLYKQAIAADSGLVEALAGLTEALHLRLVREGMSDPSISDEMGHYARAAFDADPDLPQTELALALTAPVLSDALKHFRRAMDLDPSYAEAYHQAGDYLMELAPDHALAFYRRSLALDPRAVVGHGDMSAVLAGESRFAEATAEAEQASPSVPNGPISLARIAAHRGKPDDSIKLLEGIGRPDLEQNLSAGVSLGPLLLMSSMADAGRRVEAFDWASTVAALAPHDCQVKAMLAALKYDMGQRPAARELARPLLIAAQGPKPSLADIRCGPLAAAAVHDVDAAATILRRIAANDIGLRYWTIQVGSFTAHEWLKRGWYPFSRIGDEPAIRAAKEQIARAFSNVRASVAEIFAGVDVAGPEKPTSP